MSESLRSNSESLEDAQEYDSDITNLAVNGLPRVVGEQDDTINDDSGHEEDNYDDNYDEGDEYDDRDHYSAYEEQHRSEEHT